MRGQVLKRGDTWSYVVDLPPPPDGRRRQRKKGGFHTRKEAEAALAALLSDAQKGTVVEITRQTVANSRSMSQRSDTAATSGSAQGQIAVRAVA